MKGSAENRTSERTNWQDTVMTWGTARRMLVLVRAVVHDVVMQQRRLAQLYPEKHRLDRQKHGLTWPERRRRYLLREEIAAAEKALDEALAELDGLGVAVLSRGEGRVGFPTLVNDRRAFFSWRPEEETLQYWHFENEGARRPIPSAWVKPSDVQLLGST